MSDTTLSPDPQPPPAPKKKSNLPKILGFGCGGLLLISIIGFFLIAKLGSNVIKEGSKGWAAAERTADSALHTEKYKTDLGVTRSHMKNAFPKKTWVKGVSVLGMDNYVGTSDKGAIIQLIGPDGDLASAEYTGVIGKNTSEEVTDDAVTFVNAIDASAGKRIGAIFSSAKSTGEVDESITVGTRIYKVSLSVIAGHSMATINVKPKP